MSAPLAGLAAALLRVGGAGAVLLAMTSGVPANARTVEYLTDMTAIEAAAADQGIAGPFSPAPGPGPTIALETPTVADHRVITASLYCQAYHIENPVSVLLQGLVASTKLSQSVAAGTATAPDVLLRLVSGSTLLRCMSKSDIQTACKNRVRLTAEAIVTKRDGSVVKTPLVAQVERAGRVGGFCGNIARYTGIVTREAAIDLIGQARLLAVK